MNTPKSRKRSLSQDNHNCEGPPIEGHDLTKRFQCLSDHVTQLRLEAIFHPKFENESSDRQIRSAMMEHVSEKEGYVEVSFKHSGSLLLWSGSQRFFSKNSTDNVFTHVGEILLYQHFIRAYGEDTDTDGLDRESYIHKKYQDCSSFLEKNRLTLSFELVTNVLGHHGDLPKRNYLILIAVADRAKQRFYSTVELIQFAHTFRLAHNDIWIFDSLDSCSDLFDFYDDEWEDTLTTRAKQFLDDTSSNTIPSLYPHIDFQGEILEGLVMRYVSYNNNNINNNNNDDDSFSSNPSPDALAATREQFLKTIKSLSEASIRMIELVPPDRTVDSILGDAFENNGPLGFLNMYNVKFDELVTQDDLAQSLDTLLHQAHDINRRRITFISKESHHTFDMVHISRYLLSSSNSTRETKDISQLIQTLNEMNVKVDFNITQEHTKSNQGDDIIRYLCTIHIKKDEIFQKYNKVAQEKGLMKLFRGFTIEILVDPTHLSSTSMVVSDDSITCNNQIDSVNAETFVKNDAQLLMLKMKFLPYMARTFICRNGLSILSKTGTASFEEFAYKQLSKWNVSQSKKVHWMNFFRGWAKYCSSPPSISSRGEPLAPLTNDKYLQHYDEFQKQYSRGCYNTHAISGVGSFRGLVVVVGSTESGLSSVAMTLMKILGCAQVLEYSNAFKDENSILSRISGGLICYTSVFEGLKFFRNMVNHERIYKDDFFLVLVGLSNSDIDVAYPSPDDKNKRKKMVGITKGWTQCGQKLLLHLPLTILNQDDEELYSSLSDSDTDIGVQVQSLRTLSDESQKQISRPGILVFFPQIPGAGKSFLCKDLSTHLLKEGCDKAIWCREADTTTGKYFLKLRSDIRTQPSSIFVADKNIPIQSFSHISEICSEFNLMAIAVLPNGMEDTSIHVNGSNRAVVFPFTLEFLAVCLSRVIKRDPTSHPGNLDKGNESMCMIVIKFYCLYRSITVRKLLNGVYSLGKALNNTIEVPFFSTKSSVPKMPEELRTTLISAISLSLQNPPDFSSKSAKDASFKDMEERLRNCIMNHLSYIDETVADKETCKSSFVSQLANTGKSLGDTFISRANPSVTDEIEGCIKIVSLDVEKSHVDEILKSVIKNNPKAASFYDKAMTSGEFIEKTHCTFCHKSNTSVETMRSLYNHLIGKSMEVSITHLYYSKNVAAFEISTLSKNYRGENEFMTKEDVPQSVPSPFNKFPHITIWCNDGIQPYTSNFLPIEVRKGNAVRIKLDRYVTVCGKLRYWRK